MLFYISQIVSRVCLSHTVHLTLLYLKYRATMSQKSSSAHLIHYFLSIIFAVIALIIILVLAIPIGFYGMAMYLSPSLPSISEIKTANLEMPLQIYSKDGKLIGQYGNRMSLPVTYEQIPEDFIKAFLAAEDSSFYEHSGISIKGLGRAVSEIITDDEGQTGGSTITMQVAKNYFLSPERTFNRKLTELYLARRIEEKLSKDEILTLYVNKIYMGEGAYGIKAAARKYFSKSLNKLTIAEMATLAGLPKAPSQNNPVSNPDEALERRNWILGRMQSLGYITQAEYKEAVNSPLNVKVYKERLDTNMPYLAEMARHALVARYGAEVVNSGWRVKLTVDTKDQNEGDIAIKKGLIGYDRRHGWRGAEAHGQPLSEFVTYSNMEPAKVTEVNQNSFKAELKDDTEVTVYWSGMRWAKKYLDANRIRSYPNRASDIVAKDDIVRVIANKDRTAWRLTQIPKVQGSLVALDPETGAIKSLVGGFDYRYSKFNRALQGWRQPGSTIKPLVYTAALEKGYRPDSMISDDPLKIGDWKPKNSDGRHYGNMTLRQGLYLSRNLVSIRLLRVIGTPDALHLLDQFGLDKEKLPTTLSLALGAGQATPLQMATAYATFANGGHRIQPYFIDQIYNFNNELLYLSNPQRACAVCFNNKLEKLNLQLQKDHESLLEAQLEQRAESLKALKENPDLLKNLDNQTSINAEQKVNSPLNNDLLEIYYDATPQSDRLKPALIQYSIANQAPRIVKPAVAYEMAGILRDVIQRGTATKARALGRSDIGGKTGTTNDNKDAWFAGFHPSLVSVVWVGFDQPSTLGRREYGGVAALPIWMDFMRNQLRSVPYQWVKTSNISKSELQQQDVINLTNNGGSKPVRSVKKAPSKPDSNSDDTAINPPKAPVAKRQVPVDELSSDPEAKSDLSEQKTQKSESSKNNTTQNRTSQNTLDKSNRANKPAAQQTLKPLEVNEVDALPPM